MVDYLQVITSRRGYAHPLSSGGAVKRNELALKVGKRVKVRGTFNRFGTRPEGERRTTTAGFGPVTVDGITMDHLWGREAVGLLGLEPGDEVTFTARVLQYHQDRYALTEPVIITMGGGEDE